MTDQFPPAMSFVWRPENDGQTLHKSPNDPGANTAWGVTFTTWVGWQRLHNGPVSMEDFAGLGRDDFLPLYRAMFWNSCRCGNLGALGIQVFDAAVLSGPGNAGLFLQHVLKAVGSSYTGDAQIGPIMVAAVNNAAPAALNMAFCTERERFYAASPNARYFGGGWKRRAEDCRDFVAGILNSATNGVTT